MKWVPHPRRCCEGGMLRTWILHGFVSFFCGRPSLRVGKSSQTFSSTLLFSLVTFVFASSLAGTAARLDFLWPSNARRRSLDGQQLSGSCLCYFGNLVHAAPLVGYHQERSPAWASEHAGKAALIQVDGLKHFAPFADPHATPVGNVCIPHGVVGVDADSIWYAAAEVGPYAPVLQASVCG